MEVTVLSFMRRLPLFAAVLWLTLISGARAARSVQSVQLNWLGNTPAPSVTGVSWGVPWPKGTVPRDQVFSLAAMDGKTLPLQTWPLAYWPDGSLKWSGFATVAGPNERGPFTLGMGPAGAIPAMPLRVRQSNTTIEVDAGKLKCRVPMWGTNLIDAMWIDGREVARRG